MSGLIFEVSRKMRSILSRLALLGLVWVFVFSTSLIAQDQFIIDSLKNQLASAQTDSTRIFWLNRLTWNMIVNQPQQATEFNLQARQLCEEVGDELGVARTFHYQGMIDRFEGNYPEAIENLNKALAFYESVDYALGISGAVFNLGVVYGFIGDYEKSLKSYYRQMELSETTGDEFQVGNTLNSIGSIHRKMGNYDKALEKYQQALSILEKYDRLWEITNVISNMGSLFLEIGEYQKAEPLCRQALEYNQKMSNNWGIGYSFHQLGLLKQLQNQLDSAEHYMQRAIDVRKELEQKLEYAESLAAMGAIWFDQNKVDEAVEILHEGLSLSEEIGALESQTNAHNLLSDIYFISGQPIMAYEHLKAYTTLRDSSVNEEKQRITRNLEARYESAKKDQALAEHELQIAANEVRIQRQRLTIFIVVGGFVAAVIVFGAFLAAYRSRRRLNEQKLLSLQKEKELVALKSMMAGEEKERARIARELHDGLSSLLAAIRIQFNAVQQENTELTAHTKFNDAVKRLDDANQEVRRIAHNMMPEILMKYGMVTALSDFVSGLGRTGTMSIEFSHFGMEERLPSDVELVLYRVVQELLNNVIKHSKATEVLVQINRRGKQLNITVEDNGIGFESSANTDSMGMGIHNLSSRIQYLNGNLQFESSPKKGTSVYIELNMNEIPEAE